MYSSSISKSKFTMWEYNVMWIKRYNVRTYHYQNVLEKRIEKFVKATTGPRAFAWIHTTNSYSPECQCIVNESLVICHRSRISKKEKTMSLKPFVYWAQTENDIFLKVDVKKVQGEPDVTIEEEEIEFTARGVGSQGDGLLQRYHFLVEFFLPIDPGRSVVDVVEDKACT